jgi:hypothetical protein
MRLCLALLALSVASSTAAASGPKLQTPLEYIDLLSAQVVGELGDRLYDVEANKKFVGNQMLRRGYQVTGGIGARLVMRFHPGVRLSLSLAGQFGRLFDVEGPFDAYSKLTRIEGLVGVGYEFTCGKILTLHTQTVMGFDYQYFEATGSIFAQAVRVPEAEMDAPSPLRLNTVNLRLGQEVGAHLQIAKLVALYADATFDYDGQWRVRAGIAFGSPRAKQRLEEERRRSF